LYCFVSFYFILIPPLIPPFLLFVFVVDVFSIHSMLNSSALLFSVSGTYYESGEVLPLDLVQAVAMYQLAVSKTPYRRANYELGKCYEKGLGVGMQEPGLCLRERFFFPAFIVSNISRSERSAGLFLLRKGG
jgi:hypothetical protein